jgi:hypothetical protein
MIRLCAVCHKGQVVEAYEAVGRDPLFRADWEMAVRRDRLLKPPRDRLSKARGGVGTAQMK